jgi:hypothetical protein
MTTTTRTKEELIQMLANAMTTGATCGGHSKAHSNDMIADEYRETLRVLGVKVPCNQDLYKAGVFNGKGAY